MIVAALPYHIVASYIFKNMGSIFAYGPWAPLPPNGHAPVQGLSCIEKP